MRRVLGFLVVVVLLFEVGAVVAAVVAADSAPEAARKRKPATRDPVVLVHGFDGSAASWRVMVSRLVDAGYPHDRVEAISYDSTISNVDVARQISDAIDTLRARTGARRVDIVSHSMGAISSRYYLERLRGTDAVDAWVSLGGVNEGTVWAYGCFLLRSCQEMVPNSPLLDDLNRDFPPIAKTRYGTWWSPCDIAIVPATNAQLVGATNTETPCIGHSDLKTDPNVFAQVLRFIDRETARRVTV